MDWVEAKSPPASRAKLIPAASSPKTMPALAALRVAGVEVPAATKVGSAISTTVLFTVLLCLEQ